MQLHAAAARGDIEGMTFALEHGADINARNGSGQTALVFALERLKGFSSYRGPSMTLDAVRFLIKAGTDLEAADSLGATAIHHAAAIPNLAFLEMILEHGGNAKHVTKSGYSVLTHACYQPSSPEKRAIVRRLHTAGASLDTESDFGEFPLGVCLYFGDLETLRVLLDLGADPKPLNWTPLHHAVALGNEANLAQIAPGPAEINTMNLRYQISPWLLSFIVGDIGKIHWLAERGADLIQVGRCSESPMHIAARFGHMGAVQWLNELGADPNALNEFSSSPLHEAAEWDRVKCAYTLMDLGADAMREEIHAAKSLRMLQALVERGGADVNEVDGCGDWPLKLAAEANDVKRLEWLLKHGAEVDRTSTGETALHAAVRGDSREAVDLLLAAGANPNQQDVDGWTPLFGALSREVIHTLRRAGADLRIIDQAGYGAEKWLNDPILVRALKEQL
jgi:cytohesin